jgi:PAS domain S-box-containing protein
MVIWPFTAILIIASYLVLFFSVRGRIHSVEAEARTREELSRALVEYSPRGIHFYTVDSAGRLIFTGYNPAADRMLGIDHSKLVGKTLEEAFPPLAATEVPARYRAAALEGISWSTEQVDYTDGVIRGAYEVVAFRTKTNSMAAIFSDIAERKRAEVELQNQRAFTAALLDSLPGIFYLYDYPSLRMRYWNRNHETELGFTADELRDRHILEWHVPEAKAAVLAAVERVMQESASKIEAPLVAKDDSRIPYLLTGTRFESEGKTFLMGVGIDISDRVAAEEKLRLLNAELENRVMERTRELSDANKTLEGVLSELKNSQERMILTEKMVALGQLVAGLAHELNTPLGAILSASATCSESVATLADLFTLYRSFDDEESRVFTRLLEGIGLTCLGGAGGSEDRKLCKRYRAVLERMGMERSALLADQLVDLGYSDQEGELIELAQLSRFPMIVDAAYRIASVIQSNLIIRTAADKAAYFVQALKTYSRQESSGALSSADVRIQLETVLTILRNSIKGNVEVVRRFGDVPPVPCYPDRLSQVWMNLISNSVQAMEYRGRLELVVEPIRDGQAVAVSVIDDGPGIPKEIQGRIFEPFFTTKIAGEGTGLGLDICRRILGEIGATIDFESEPGRTRFTAVLSMSDGAKSE